MFEYNDENTPEIPKDAMLVRADAKAYGAVTALTHRASRNSWSAFGSGRVRGFATEKDDIDTMKVYNLSDEGAADWNPSTYAVKDVPRKARKSSNAPLTEEEVAQQEKVREATMSDVERFTNLTNDIGSDFS